MWFPASWAPIVAEQLFEKSSKSDDLHSNIQHGQPARGLSQNPSRGHAWHQPTQESAGPSVPAAETENNEVMYKIRRWSLPGTAVMPVLNVSSRVTWLELDDKALLDSYGVLQEGILCDVFSQKCSAAWQGAPGQRLTVSIMLPGRQLADEWLDFMLSQVAHLHYQGGSHRDDHGANFSQRTAQIAGQASVDGHQDYLGSTIQSYVHGGSHWDVS